MINILHLPEELIIKIFNMTVLGGGWKLQQTWSWCENIYNYWGINKYLRKLNKNLFRNNSNKLLIEAKKTRYLLSIGDPTAILKEKLRIKKLNTTSNWYSPYSGRRWPQRPPPKGLCINKCGFFGSKELNNLCSICYKKNKK